ncbi:lanthionine synthetase LanC family protein [Empedobacter sp.]|uniref:lanthionine synthetase LanC family protein n=1 Tax=Empedobacter sp. TaxID=1927715 RepID=UPI0028AEEE2D|nr:lanthionine synthetase LanC family protein [Empedobacter sp.]
MNNILNKDRIYSLLDKIMETIYNKDNKYDNVGLLSGTVGESIFIQKYSLLINENYLDKLNNNIDIIYQKIDDTNISSTYCSGIAGVCLGLDYIYQKSFGDDHIPFDFISLDIEEYLFEEMKKFISKNDFDFLHGAIGVGLFFLEKVKKGYLDDMKYLDYLVDSLIKSSIEDEKDVFKWKDKDGLVNISLSHGMSSILIFLLDVYSLNLENSSILEKYIKGGIKFILKQKLEDKKFISLFPSNYKSLIVEEIKGSRLGWCYGDLGIAILFRKYSEVFNDKDIYELYEQILEHSLNRKSYKESLIVDVSICHGAIGISMILFNEFILTKNPMYQDIAIYWLNKSISMLESDLDSTFFNVLTMKNEKPTNLLEGLSGIGLILLGFLHPEETDWNKFLLL